MVRPLQLGVDDPAHGADCTTLLQSAVASLAPIDQWHCLSCVPSFSPPRLYWRLGCQARTSIVHLVGEHAVPRDPVRLRPAVRRDLTAPVVTLPRSISTSVHSISLDPLDTLRTFFWLESMGSAPPVPRQSCTSDAPTRQTDRLCPTTVSVAYMCVSEDL